MTSSRESPAAAGWQAEAGSHLELVDEPDSPFSWMSPVPLWRSRNDWLARLFGDPTDERRQAWIEGLGGQDGDFGIAQHAGDSISFLVAGDTGEGDASQYAVVASLDSQSDDTAFLFICGDVIYPAGGIDEYSDKFFRPYRAYDDPIYAVPGNHDWYDDATGFMYWFCGAERAPRRPRRRPLSKAWLRDRLWRPPPEAEEQAVREMRRLRAGARQQTRQPGPYFFIDAGPLRLVGIDTGILGGIDRAQGEWLRRVSRESERPKVLLTGKPLYVDGERHPCPIAGGGHVDDVVTTPENNYIAAIGGDIHNYQRYPVKLDDGRTLMYLVSGGGGAFMHETHTIGNLDRLDLGVAEADFRCYPLRGDSLARYSQLWARKLRWLIGPLWRRLAIPPDVAAAIVADLLGLEPTRDAPRPRVTLGARLGAWLIFALLPTRGRRGLHLPLSEWLDWNEPPLFKSFLRVDATPGEVTIRCFAATGARSHEGRPPCEDHVGATRQPDGRWRWSW